MNVNPRSVLLIVAALLIAGVTAFLARSWLNAERPVQVAVSAPKPVEDNHVLVAAKNLPTGKILQQGDLRWQAWPDVKLPETYIRKTSGKEMDELYGSVVRRSVRTAEPVTRPSLVASGERGFLAAVLSPGMRAISIRVNATSGVSGFVFPGDRVDLILTHRVGAASGNEARASETVLTNVRVLAIDQRADDQTNAPSLAKTVTFEVSAKQAERVALASDMGELSLSLRSLTEPLLAGVDVEDIADLDQNLAHEGDSYTWESDVSRLLARGGGAGGPSVKVMRGSETKRMSFGGAE